MNRHIFIIIIFLAMARVPANAFSLLSHEAIIDTTWKKTIKPLLLQKYPGSTEEELKDAYAYVYGGALVPDIGYYPFGSLMFSHLLHYVRTGDFSAALIKHSQNLNEYAFALGMICHYNADKYGHPLGTNLAVPLLFPKARKKHGDTITYDEDHKLHIRAEFGFDVLQTAKGNYKSQDYQNFIGFKIEENVLRKAFQEVYGLELDEVFGSLPLAVETFRFSVKELFPVLTKDAWKSKQSFITKANPLATKDNYRYKMKRKDYKKDYGAGGIRSFLLSSFIAITPKVGPFAGLDYKAPTGEAEKLYENSFNTIVKHYTAHLESLKSGEIKLDNINFDTGEKIRPGEYKSTDEAHYALLMKLKRKKFRFVEPALRENLLTYYNNPRIEPVYAKKSCKRKKISKAIDKMKLHSLSDGKANVSGGAAGSKS